MYAHSGQNRFSISALEQEKIEQQLSELPPLSKHPYSHCKIILNLALCFYGVELSFKTFA
jgi:hypothetical protein